MPATDTISPAASLAPEPILAALLEATGDLDSADVLDQTLPPWLLNAPPATLDALARTIEQLRIYRAKVAADLTRLTPLNAFCIARFNRAFSERWAVTVDIEKDHLELPGAECGCDPELPDGDQPAPTSRTGFLPATLTLLEVAMQNLTLAETADAGWPAGSAVRLGSAPAGVPGLTPAEFAKFCRALDLGRLYQEHFQDVFGFGRAPYSTVTSSATADDIKQLKKHLFDVDTHLASLKGDISQAGYQTLQAFVAADGVVQANNLAYEGRPLIMQGIEALGSCIWGVVVFAVRSIELYPGEWCLVYMPGEPHRPLFEYPSFSAFQEYLTLKLQVGSYKDYFLNCLDEDNKADFFQTFAATPSLGFIRQLPIEHSLFGFMLQSHVGKMQIDARKLAVPTDDVDEDVRQKRLLTYLDVGVTVVSLAGFFVPVFGQLMMGVAVGQLVAEVYEGVEDWQHGDNDAAFAHLLSIAQNIVMFGVTAAGQKVVGSLVTRTLRQHREFFQQFAAIIKPGGQSRLWKTELKVYQQPPGLGHTAVANAEGFFDIDGQTCVRIDHDFYAVEAEAPANIWRIKHPLRSDAYRPPIENCGEGGWRHIHDDPHEWDSGDYTLKRIDPRLASMENSRLESILRITGTSASELQHRCSEGLPMPARLKDSLERWRLEDKINQFATDMHSGTTNSTEHVTEQLHSLPALSGWPTDHYIKVVGDDLSVTTYPVNSVLTDALAITVTQAQLRAGQLLERVLAQLHSKEVTALLGGRFASGEQRALLAQKLGAAIATERRPLLEQLYRLHDQSSDSDVVKVRETFPQMPARLVQEVIDRAPSTERLHLRTTGRLPLGLAQSVREARDAVRLDRAMTGLSSPQIANADTEKLAIQLLPRLSGWDSGVRLELRQGYSKGQLLESVGEPSAEAVNKYTIVKSSRGYEAFDSADETLGAVASGQDGLQTATLNALSPRQRMALGFSDPRPVDGARLRGKLLSAALESRTDSARVLSEGAFDASRAEPACMVQGDPPGAATNYSRAMLRKIKKLYPLFSEVQAAGFLDDLAGDHLSREKKVRQLQMTLERLRGVLSTWSGDEAATALPGSGPEEGRFSRRQCADLIELSWRRMLLAEDDNRIMVPTLKLNGMRVGKLPNLPVDLSFDHVTHLSLRNMDLDDDVAYFLKSFKQLKRLELDGNRLTRLPEVISLMPNIEELWLGDNQLRLTEYTLAKLAQLNTLKVLKLSNNPLGATVDVSNMFDLRLLAVRETGATELPEGLARLPYLDVADLRDNNISELPDWLFSTSRRFSETINLRHNPLSNASRRQLQSYHDRVGVGMGYIEDDIARLNEQAARELWLTAVGGESGARRAALWTGFKDERLSDGLFHLLSELRHTADSEFAHEDMTRRVWEVLEATESNAALRDQVLDLAANPINCTDTAAQNFSNLELAVEIEKVTNPAGAVRLTAKPLLRLGRGLFRLAKLNAIAMEHIKQHPQTDPLEVSLAFRTGLADHVELPGQPRHMRYASLSGVTNSDLELAHHQLTTAELSGELMNYMVKQPFWSDYLKRNFPLQFSRVTRTYEAQMETEFAQVESLDSASYMTRVDAIKVAREAAENTVLERLTTDALKWTELGICASVDS